MTATPGYATQQEAYQALLQAGASPDVALILAAITRPESSGYTAATNNYQGNQYLGLWQVGSMHGFDNARLRSNDILYQAQAALQVYNQQGFNAWETYTNGSYKQYLDQNPTALALAHANALSYSNSQAAAPQSAGPAALQPFAGGAILGSPGGSVLDSPGGGGDGLANRPSDPSGLGSFDQITAPQGV